MNRPILYRVITRIVNVFMWISKGDTPRAKQTWNRCTQGVEMIKEHASSSLLKTHTKDFSCNSPSWRNALLQGVTCKTVYYVSLPQHCPEYGRCLKCLLLNLPSQNLANEVWQRVGRLHLILYPLHIAWVLMHVYTVLHIFLKNGHTAFRASLDYLLE